MSRMIHTLRLGLMVCLVVGLLPLPVLATEGWYVSIKGGINGGPDANERVEDLSLSVDSELGLAILGAVGSYLTDGIRIEAEISWRRNTADTLKFSGSFRGLRFPESLNAESSLSNLAAMVNAAYDWNITPRFRPFVLAGVGMSRVTIELDEIEIFGQRFSVNADDTKYTFAYQGGVGIDYALTDTVSVDVGYRFFGTPTVDFSGTEVNNINHTGLIGLTHAF